MRQLPPLLSPQPKRLPRGRTSQRRRTRHDRCNRGGEGPPTTLALRSPPLPLSPLGLTPPRAACHACLACGGPPHADPGPSATSPAAADRCGGWRIRSGQRPSNRGRIRGWWQPNSQRSCLRQLDARRYRTPRKRPRKQPCMRPECLVCGTVSRDRQQERYRPSTKGISHALKPVPKTVWDRRKWTARSRSLSDDRYGGADGTPKKRGCECEKRLNAHRSLETGEAMRPDSSSTIAVATMIQMINTVHSN